MLHIKPWQRSLALWALATILLSLCGGYGVAYRVWSLKREVLSVRAQQFKEEQARESSRQDQEWLHRLSQHPPILESMSYHSYINPPNREIIVQQIKSLAKEVNILSLTFAPEKQLHVNGEYAFCAQQISAHVSASDDRQLLAWVQAAEAHVPGIFSLVSLHIKRGSNHTVIGELVWQWSFLRLSL